MKTHGFSLFFGLIGFLATLLPRAVFADTVVFDKIAEITAQGGQVTSVAIKGGFLYTADKSGMVVASNTSDGSLRWSKRYRPESAEFDGLTALAVSPSGDLLVTATRSGKILVIQSSDGRMLKTFDRPSVALVTTVAVAHDGGTAVTGDENGLIRQYNLADGSSEVIGSHEWSILAVRYRTDDRLLVGDPSSLKLWDVREKKVLATIVDPSSPGGESFWFASMGYSPDLTMAAAVSGQKAYVFDLASGQVLSQIENAAVTQPIKFVEISPDNSELVTTENSGAVSIWDAKTGKLKASAIAFQFGFITHLLPLPEKGRFLLAVSTVVFPGGGFRPGVGIWQYHFNGVNQ
jgi:WD40 repeat protein